MHNNNYMKVFKALEFASERHKNQFRKGEEKIPYINHPINVATLLTEFNETETNLLSAAVLHDVIEDTAEEKREIDDISKIIKKQFGNKVLNIVLEVTDDKSLPYQERKRLQIENTPYLSKEGKKLKISDKICNIKDMMNHPPVDWPTERKIMYLEWAKDVVEGARGVNPAMEEHFDNIIQKAYNSLINK
ncbi:MAG: HD domain-containing protein [Bacteroidota bacterium]